MDFPEFRTILINARLDRGWTQTWVAGLLGVTPGVVSMWESGARTPTEQSARRWADALEVPLPDDTEGWFSRKTWCRRAPCGTRPGYDRHRRDGEEACRPCKDATNAYQSEYRQRFIA